MGNYTNEILEIHIQEWLHLYTYINTYGTAKTTLLVVQWEMRSCSLKKCGQINCLWVQLILTNILAVAEIVGIDKKPVQRIYHDRLNMKKVCSKVVLRILPPGQKVSQMNICADIFKILQTDPTLLEREITIMWWVIVFTFDLETKP